MSPPPVTLSADRPETDTTVFDIDRHEANFGRLALVSDRLLTSQTGPNRLRVFVGCRQQTVDS